MSESSRVTVHCPGCDTVLVVDSATGAVISHSKTQRERAGEKSFEDLFARLGEDKDRREKLFEREVASVKDQSRILEEKFEDAMRRAEEDDDESPPLRAFDLD